MSLHFSRSSTAEHFVEKIISEKTNEQKYIYRSSSRTFQMHYLREVYNYINVYKAKTH
jgi:hypothetical protein